jgi:nucleoside-diphosphate-sugar epimerase
VTGRALITGASGFIGSHLARRLLTDGTSVHVIVRPGSSLAILGDTAVQVHAHTHDGTTEGMVDILQRIEPETVYHLASRFIATHQTADITSLIESNVLFGTQLLEAMAVTQTRHLVTAGTSWQHYENAPYRPVSLYAATKQAYEDIVRFYADAGLVRAVSLHLYDTYGPSDPRPKLIHLLTRAAKSGERLAMSPGEQLLNLVHVDDVIDAFLTAGQRLRDGSSASFETFAVSADRTLSLRDLVTVFGRVHGAPLSITWGGRPYRPREVMRPWDAGEPIPGWAPKVSLEQGIRRLLDEH